MADDGDRRKKNVRNSGYIHSTVKGLRQFVKTIPYIIWREVLKLFNNNKNQWNKRGKSSPWRSVRKQNCCFPWELLLLF